MEVLWCIFKEVYTMYIVYEDIVIAWCETEIIQSTLSYINHKLINHFLKRHLQIFCLENSDS